MTTPRRVAPGLEAAVGDAARGSAGGWFEVLTGRGPAAIALVRVGGRAAITFLARHVRFRRASGLTGVAAGQVLRGALIDRDGAALDDVLVSVHRVPDDARPEDWEFRLHVHGGGGVMARCCELLQESGLAGTESTSADPCCAHNTNKAGLFGEEDLLQYEASALLPRMLTRRGALWLLRQPAAARAFVHDAVARLEREGHAALEAVQGAVREVLAAGGAVERFARPLRIAVIGPPNAGKSTLINALCQQHVSLVSPQPGTTRDWVEAPDELDGFPVMWIDTAGLRVAGDALEAEGIRRTRLLMAESDHVVVVLDASPGAGADRAALSRAYAAVKPAAVVLNKCDLLGASAAPADCARAVSSSEIDLGPVEDGLPAGWRSCIVAAAAATGFGLGEARRRLAEAAHLHALARGGAAAYSDRLRAILMACVCQKSADEVRAALSLAVSAAQPVPHERRAQPLDVG